MGCLLCCNLNTWCNICKIIIYEQIYKCDNCKKKNCLYCIHYKYENQINKVKNSNKYINIKKKYLCWNCYHKIYGSLQNQDDIITFY